MHDEKELATRPKKVARMEFQDLLLDEVPTREFGQTMGMFMFQSILRLHSIGVALLGLAHLVTLKEYDRAFLQKASAKYPAGSGLRAPNSVELEWADKQLWGEIASRLEKGWTFDDSVHEVVHVRSSIPSYLQPRPVAASVPNIPARHGGQGKGDWGSGKSSAGRGRGGKKGGKGRGSSSSGKGTGSDRPPRQEWVARFGKRTLFWRTASTSTCVVWQPTARLVWVITVLMSARPPHIEGARRRIFRRFLRAVMVSLTICFRIRLPSLGPHLYRLKLLQLKQEGLPWEPLLLFLLQECWMPLFRKCRYLPQAWLLQAPRRWDGALSSGPLQWGYSTVVPGCFWQ